MKRNSIIPYRPDLKLKARELRKNSTLSEVLLWQEIKDKKLLGYQFHRQVPMLDYIVDFYCHELKLAIEVDGDSHEYKVSYDIMRQKELEAYDVHFLRFDDMDVKKKIMYVLSEITFFIQDNKNKQ
ncbi:endonuclease domain-containing protein [Pontibacter diazotrophicus]|uniref:Endonuclease domain-containing protein n=1 Tax=Pontibacter diazotrophicus TaxID=1400979 RepID=A0A3D8LHL1_9BACT|nr:DUF559 domain-containing protein [Pontibacter diazotrophicus]RDV16931.1 endonuclease domain-containing protein [Pontibacter diazotrophicus]